MEKTRLELFRSALDILILKSLIWGLLHGYTITGFIRSQSDGAPLVEEGTLYSALWRLESNGFLQAEWGLSADVEIVMLMWRIAPWTRSIRLDCKKKPLHLPRNSEALCRQGVMGLVGTQTSGAQEWWIFYQGPQPRLRGRMPVGDILLLSQFQ